MLSVSINVIETYKKCVNDWPTKYPSGKLIVEIKIILRVIEQEIYDHP